MTKQDQIAEMMALITTAKLKDGDEVCSVRDYYAVQLAYKLYDEGYRKIDGNDYVSREWHDEQVLHAEGEIERLRCRVRRANELLNIAIDATFRGAVLRLAEKLKERIRDVVFISKDEIINWDILINETAQKILKSET